MIRVICAILAITIQDLEMQMGNSNLPLRKSVIRFEPLIQKEETDKQIAGALYYKY